MHWLKLEINELTDTYYEEYKNGHINNYLSAYLVRIGGEQVIELFDFLLKDKSINNTAKLLVISGLGDINTFKARKVLIEVLEKPEADWRLRYWIVGTLGQNKQVDTLPALLKVTENEENQAIKDAALRAIEAIKLEIQK